MKRLTGSLKFLAATIIWVFVAALFFTMTAAGRTAQDREEMAAYYRQQESGMVENVRVFLEEQGFENSGVMLTCVTESDGSRAYTLTVHHREIDKMSEGERERLAGKLAALSFQDESCSFFQKFLCN